MVQMYGPSVSSLLAPTPLTALPFRCFSLQVGVRRQDGGPHGQAAGVPAQHVRSVRPGDDRQPGLGVHARAPTVSLWLPGRSSDLTHGRHGGLGWTDA